MSGLMAVGRGRIEDSICGVGWRRGVAGEDDESGGGRAHHPHINYNALP